MTTDSLDSTASAMVRSGDQHYRAVGPLLAQAAEARAHRNFTLAAQLTHEADVHARAAGAAWQWVPLAAGVRP